MHLSSPAFDDGEPIPDRYGYGVDDRNPPLVLDDVPDEATVLALVMDDPDAVEPAGKVWDHWVVWNVDPRRTEIPEGWVPADATQGRNDYGDIGYGGPNPPDREHTYRFIAYALDSRVHLPEGATKADLQEAIDGSIIAEAVLTGTYAP